MKVLVVHYHLKAGGVTTVIRRQMCALSSRGVDASVLSGEAPASSLKGGCGTVAVAPALAYDDPDSALTGNDARDPDRVRAIVNAIRREADALGSQTIIHVHNPTIRKNGSLLEALKQLCDEGRPVLFHIHDLAEDWRPDVYSDQPYPAGAAWAAINRFDARALSMAMGASTPDESAGPVSFLPNPVPRHSGQTAATAGTGRPGLVLYPVRGIRRKNLGEAVLLSLFMRPGSSIGVTLPPVNPRDVPSYDAWRERAAATKAPILFGMGLSHDFENLYARSRAVVTTSIKEGFGLSYLEPAARGVPTLGRRLPRVVADFENAGLAFPGLYDAIWVPPGLFDEEAFGRRVRQTIGDALAAFRLHDKDGPLSVSGLAGSVLDMLSGGGRRPDFGRLDETAQAQVLQAVAVSKDARSAIVAANPWLEGWDGIADTLQPPPAGALDSWSEESYAGHLVEVYKALLEGGGGEAPDKRVMLGSYLIAEGYHGVGL